MSEKDEMSVVLKHLLNTPVMLTSFNQMSQIIILIITFIIATTIFCCSFNMNTVLYAVSCVALCGMVMAHKGDCEGMNVTGDERENNEILSPRGLL